MRRTGLAAVWDRAVSAGTMASSSGNARLTPQPRSNVRLDRCFLVTIMASRSPRQCPGIGHGARTRPHLKRRALDNPQDHRRPAIVGTSLSHDLADGRLVRVLG